MSYKDFIFRFLTFIPNEGKIIQPQSDEYGTQEQCLFSWFKLVFCAGGFLVLLEIYSHLFHLTKG